MFCMNCGKPINGTYCSNCGKSISNVKVNVGGIQKECIIVKDGRLYDESGYDIGKVHSGWPPGWGDPIR